MFCNKCGASNPDDSKFCQKCGASFETAAVTPEAPSAPAAPTAPAENYAQPAAPYAQPMQQPYAPQKNKTVMIAAIAAASAVVLACFIGGIVLLAGSGSGSDSGSGNGISYSGNNSEPSQGFDIGSMFKNREDVSDVEFSFSDELTVLCSAASSQTDHNHYGRMSKTLNGVYTGEWADGKPDGKGVFKTNVFSFSLSEVRMDIKYTIKGYDLYVQCIYDGEWSAGKFTGSGKITYRVFWDKGTDELTEKDFVFSGEFLNGKLNGAGKFEAQVGTCNLIGDKIQPFNYSYSDVVESGTYKNGLLDGEGTRVNYSSFTKTKMLEQIGMFSGGEPVSGECSYHVYSQSTGSQQKSGKY